MATLLMHSLGNHENEWNGGFRHFPKWKKKMASQECI